MLASADVNCLKKETDVYPRIRLTIAGTEICSIDNMLSYFGTSEPLQLTLTTVMSDSYTDYIKYRVLKYIR